jgi:hypothetical protein
MLNVALKSVQYHPAGIHSPDFFRIKSHIFQYCFRVFRIQHKCSSIDMDQHIDKPIPINVFIKSGFAR